MRLRVAVLIAILAVALTWCATDSRVSAEPTPATTLRKFDEFGALSHCDLTARLDNFAIQLANTPNSTGYIVSYGPEGEGPGTGRSTLPRLKDYLVNARGLADNRVNTVYGGRYEVLTEPKIQLWIVPAGATLPGPHKFETNINTFKGMFYEEKIEEFIDVYYEDEDEGMGPGIGLAADASFADMLQQQKKAVPYVVVYNGEAAVPGSARRLAARQIEALKTYKVDVSRIRTIFGGVRKKTAVQLWITGPSDPPPVADAGAEAPPLRNAQITSQADSTMGDPRNERAAFNRMLEVLRDQPTVKAVVIVTFAAPQSEPEPEVESSPPIIVPPAPPEPAEAISPPLEEDHPPADLPKLVEKWREELTKTHKINLDRFIVLFTTSQDLSGNYLDLWINPPGQPLPDPNADEEEDTEALKIYENLPPDVTSTMGYRLGALIRGN
jgi:hypothetical protein